MQVAHIVNVVGRAEPGQDQQQKRLHFSDQEAAFFPATFTLSAVGAQPSSVP